VFIDKHIYQPVKTNFEEPNMARMIILYLVDFNIAVAGLFWLLSAQKTSGVSQGLNRQKSPKAINCGSRAQRAFESWSSGQHRI